MATTTRRSTRRTRRGFTLLAVAITASATIAAIAASPARRPLGRDGAVPRAPVSVRAAVEVAFPRERGNLAFLGEQLLLELTKRSGMLRRVARWRDLGRPEAALVGVQYIGNDFGERRGPWIVGRPGARSWIFNGIAAAVLERRNRDRQDAAQLSARHARARGDPEPARPRHDGPDDVVRNACRSEGLRRGRVHARGRDPATRRDAPRVEPARPARERLAVGVSAPLGRAEGVV